MVRITFNRLAWRSFRFYWRTHITILLGCVVAGTALVGALLVGDSVEYSLRSLALQRLGTVEFAMDMGHRFFGADLAVSLEKELGTPVASVLRVDGVALRQADNGVLPAQVNRVQVLGVDRLFWRFVSKEEDDLAADEIALSEKLARALEVGVGDEIGLRVEQVSLLPSDAPLSSRNEKLSKRGNFIVKRVVPDSGLGRFSLRANQIAPYNAFVNIDWLQGRLGMDGRANLMLIAGGEKRCRLGEVDDVLKRVWRLKHVGLSLRKDESLKTLQLESDRIFIDPAVSVSALSLDSVKPVGVLAYLVNGISKGTGSDSKAVPYSFMVASSSSGVADDEIVINSWVSEQIGAMVGDVVTVKYHELQAAGGFEERSREFKVRDVVSVESLAGERDLMPVFPGLTDVENCRDWNIGIPVDEVLLADKANQVYWEKYRTTPKAVVSLVAGRDMWANRFGDLSAVRYEIGYVQGGDIEKDLLERISPADVGLFFVPVREQALRAVDDAMNFGELFVSMSFFLIVAALMLTGLLFVFGVQQRAEGIGTLLAIGFRPRQVRMLLLLEGGLVALAGSLVGGIIGGLYTRAMIWGLSTYWQGAIAGSAIQYHADLGTIVEGVVLCFICSVIAMVFAIWHQTGRPARDLLVSGDEGLPVAGQGKRRLVLALSLIGVVCAISISVYVVVAGVENIAPAFFGVGALLLFSGLGFAGCLLRSLDAISVERLSINMMGVKNASRRRGRSLTAIGLLACGCFMVLAVSLMQEDIEGQAGYRWSGSGGFALFAESTLSVPDPLGGEKGRQMFKLDKVDVLKDSGIVSIKVHDGDEAGCLNLNRAQSPRLLGVVSDDFLSRGSFVAGEDKGHLWGLLNTKLPDGVIPGIVGDSDTAMWGLMKKVGEGDGEYLSYKDETGKSFRVKLVGKLPMRLSVFHGAVLISVDDFADRYPSEAGYRMFLVDVPADDSRVVRDVLSQKMGRMGCDISSTTERILEFYMVEKTYLGMFLVLGGLGLLLGSVGLGIVVMRNVLERRGELAVLGCMGFSPADIVRLLVAEHWMLLFAGLLIGVVASVVGVLPTLMMPGTDVSYGLVVGLLVAVMCCGLVWIATAARIALRGSLIGALRKE
ncbi:MAG: FtsX-like permease family protein [Kiritimatiellae bacterium]|nr:FtsX-like permease family protein [Kiritimatiellia bacterium]